MVNCKFCKNTKNCWFTGEDHETEECKDYIPTTNADRIRAMSDEELAIWISALYTTQYLIKADPNFWAEWLKEEVK